MKKQFITTESLNKAIAKICKKDNFTTYLSCESTDMGLFSKKLLISLSLHSSSSSSLLSLELLEILCWFPYVYFVGKFWIAAPLSCWWKDFASSDFRRDYWSKSARWKLFIFGTLLGLFFLCIIFCCLADLYLCAIFSISKAAKPLLSPISSPLPWCWEPISVP